MTLSLWCTLALCVVGKFVTSLVVNICHLACWANLTLCLLCRFDPLLVVQVRHFACCGYLTTSLRHPRSLPTFFAHSRLSCLGIIGPAGASLLLRIHLKLRCLLTTGIDFSPLLRGVLTPSLYLVTRSCASVRVSTRCATQRALILTTSWSELFDALEAPRRSFIPGAPLNDCLV